MDLPYWPNRLLYKNMKMILTLEIATYVGGGSVIHCTSYKLFLVFYSYLLISLGEFIIDFGLYKN